MIKKFKQFESLEYAAGYEEAYKRAQKELEEVRTLLPSAKLEVLATIRGVPAMWGIICDAHKFYDLGEQKAFFAGNAFDTFDLFKDVIDDLEGIGATNIEVGGVNVDDRNEDGSVKSLYADTLYFKNVRRSELFPPDNEEDMHDFEMNPFWSCPRPDELDCWDDETSKKSKNQKWHGIYDPYGEEAWDDELPKNQWRAWWD